MIDVLFLLLILILIFIGLYKGFFYILWNFISLFVGVYLAVKLNDYIVKTVALYFNADILVLKIISFLFVLLFSVSTFKVFHGLVDMFVKKRKILNISNRIGGGILGLVIGIFLIYIVQVYSESNSVLKQMTENSKIIQLLKKLENKTKLRLKV